MARLKQLRRVRFLSVGGSRRRLNDVAVKFEAMARQTGWSLDRSGRIAVVAFAGNVAPDVDSVNFRLIKKIQDDGRFGAIVRVCSDSRMRAALKPVASDESDRLHVVDVSHLTCGAVAAIKANLNDPRAMNGEPSTVASFVRSHSGSLPADFAHVPSPDCDAANAKHQSSTSKLVLPGAYVTSQMILDWSQPKAVRLLGGYTSGDTTRIVQAGLQGAVTETLADGIDLSVQTAHAVVLSDPTRVPDVGTLLPTGLNEVFAVSVMLDERDGSVLIGQDSVGSADYALSHVRGLNGESGLMHVVAIDHDHSVAKRMLSAFKAVSAFKDKLVESFGTYIDAGKRAFVCE